MFRPVITGLFAAIRTGLWKKIGYIQVNDFEYPNFIATNYNQKTGKASIWFLWNGEKYIRLGTELPEKYKELEYHMVWSPYDVVDRIETGKYPFPYRELIELNEFSPWEVVRVRANPRIKQIGLNWKRDNQALPIH